MDTLHVIIYKLEKIENLTNHRLQKHMADIKKQYVNHKKIKELTWKASLGIKSKIFHNRLVTCIHLSS